MKSKQLIVGYTVQAVDSSGKQKTETNVGDKVLLMCGTTCKPSTTDYDAKYRWTDVTGGGNTVIASTREHTVTITQRTTSSLYKCELLESKCGSLSRTLTVSAGAAGNYLRPHTILCLHDMIILCTFLILTTFLDSAKLQITVLTTNYYYYFRYRC